MVVVKLLLGQFDQVFQYIQEFIGFFILGIVVLFVLGMFWKKIIVNGGLVVVIGFVVFSLSFKLLLFELLFMDCVGIVFLLCVGLVVIVSLIESKGDYVNVVELNDINFKMILGFNLVLLVLMIVVVVFYIIWW